MAGAGLDELIGRAGSWPAAASISRDPASAWRCGRARPGPTSARPTRSCARCWQRKSIAHSSSASGIYSRACSSGSGSPKRSATDPAGRGRARRRRGGARRGRDRLPADERAAARARHRLRRPAAAGVQHETVFSAGIAAARPRARCGPRPHRLPHGAGRRADHPPERDGARLSRGRSGHSPTQSVSLSNHGNASVRPSFDGLRTKAAFAARRCHRKCRRPRRAGSAPAPRSAPRSAAPPAAPWRRRC